MAIENFSFWPKKNNLLILCAFIWILSSCKTSPKHETSVSHRESQTTQTPTTHNAEVPTAPAVSDELPPTPPSAPAPLAVGVTPKIGLILGPGALRSYAHVGVVQELVKQRMPIHAIVGIEMGALVAAIYANKGQPYDVEWQMMKLKEPDLIQKGLLSSQVKAGDVSSLHDFINLALSSARAENSKVPFACPALQMEKQQVYMMSRGAYSEMLPYCLTLPPLFRPYQKNVAGVFSLKASIEQLRAKGATYIVYVDLLSGPIKINGASEDTQVLWSLAAETLNRPEKGLDYVIHVPVKDYDLLDFGHRRELIQKGQQSAVEAISKISKNLNL